MIYVIRHGETQLNLENRLQGRNGMSLNKNGIAQAESTKNVLKDISFNVVFSSPQERAVQTAKIVAELEVTIDKRLDVFDLGEADRLLVSEVQMKGPIPNPEIYSGVEDINSYMSRVYSFMDEMKRKYDNKVNILICGHKCTTACIGTYFNGIPQDKNIFKYASTNGNFNTYDIN